MSRPEGALPREGVLLAIDPGEKRVGLALCDSRQVVARPLQTAPRALRQLLPLLERIIAEHAVAGIVMGLPLRERGARGREAQRAETLAHHLRARWPDLPLMLWDERWSSRVADERGRGAPRADRRLGRDALAAAVILQGYLDARGEG
jgi:putative Holliday junction resolvase